MNIYNFLNCTKEVLYCLEGAKQIANITNFKQKNIVKIKPIHLGLSLLFNSKLIHKIFDINFTNIKKEIILNVIFNYNNKNLIDFNKKVYFNYSYFDKKILNLLSGLNFLGDPFNTLILFYYIVKQNLKLYSDILTILKIKNIKSNIYLIKNYTNNFPLKIKIPHILKKILKILNKNNNLIGREKEIKYIIEILTRKLNRNIILLGETGIGKTSLVSKLVSLMPNKIFLELNITNLITHYKNKKLITILFKFLRKNNNIILYCKNIHLLFNNLDHIKNMIYELLSLNKLQIIGTINSEITYDEILVEEEQLKFLFSKININELNKNILFLIMKYYLKKNKINWINDNILELIIDLGKKYIKNYVFPKIGFLILDSLIHKFNKIKKITKRDILHIISYYSEFPSTLILRENTNYISNIDLNLKKYVFGQDIAVKKIASSIKRAYIGLKDKNKPIGSWLLCGPSGTGKTELVKSLALLLFGSEKELIRFDMSEFMEKHAISKLIGSPPGYIGSNEGGLLTEAVKKKPYSVILFDEIEKAHQDINNIMLQLLDEGNLTDSKGEHIDFTNTLIIYTSNLGCSSLTQFKSFQNGEELTKEEYKLLSNNVDIAVKKFFRPELLNRLDSIVVFKPLSISCLINIIDKFIYKLNNKLKENNTLLRVDLEEKMKMTLAEIAYDPLYGARPLKRIIDQCIEKPISELIINYKFKTPYIFSLIANEIKKDKDKDKNKDQEQEEENQDKKKKITIDFLLQKI